MKKKYSHIAFAVLLLAVLSLSSSHAENSIMELKNLDPNTNEMLKSLRQDVRKSIYVVKSRRPENELPALNFYQYQVAKDDTFWSILARTSLDMDTLISVNDLSSPKDISPGMKIYIPNMRGIIARGNSSSLADIMKQERILSAYVLKANRSEDLDRDYLFIPCGKITNLERSLFLGSGFMYPLYQGKRTSGFGMRKNPFNGRYYEFHSGVDLACGIGSKVYAARDGRVIFSGIEGGYGLLIVVKHEYGYRSYYGHLSRSFVKPGQVIKRGTVIGLSGNSGRTTGPHLHFEVRKGKRPINPGILLRR